MKFSDIKRKVKKVLRLGFFRGGNCISYIEAKELLKPDNKGILLDVRSIQEYNEYHLSGAICIPLYELEQRIERVVTDKMRLIIVYCQSGHRSQKAITLLQKKGYTNLYEIDGGIDNL